MVEAVLLLGSSKRHAPLSAPLCSAPGCQICSLHRSNPMLHRTDSLRRKRTMQAQALQGRRRRLPPSRPIPSRDRGKMLGRRRRLPPSRPIPSGAATSRNSRRDLPSRSLVDAGTPAATHVSEHQMGRKTTGTPVRQGYSAKPKTEHGVGRKRTGTPGGTRFVNGTPDGTKKTGTPGGTRFVTGTPDGTKTTGTPGGTNGSPGGVVPGRGRVILHCKKT